MYVYIYTTSSLVLPGFDLSVDSGPLSTFLEVWNKNPSRFGTLIQVGRDTRGPRSLKRVKSLSTILRTSYRPQSDKLWSKSLLI